MVHIQIGFSTRSSDHVITNTPYYLQLNYPFSREGSISI